MFLTNFGSFLLIMIGGAFGSLARFLIGEWINLAMKKNSTANFSDNFSNSFFGQFFGVFFSNFVAFPFGTFAINIAGSMLAGILYFFLIRDLDGSNQYLRPLLLVGFLGGFTTFSSFSLDFFRLFTAGQTFCAFTYAISSVVFSILAVFFGYNFSKFLIS